MSSSELAGTEFELCVVRMRTSDEGDDETKLYVSWLRRFFSGTSDGHRNFMRTVILTVHLKETGTRVIFEARISVCGHIPTNFVSLIFKPCNTFSFRM